MKSSVRIITSFLKDGSSQATQILTIWGMAGIGKTYLANYIFKLHYLDFERSCFLEDIERRCSPPNGLLDLQKQLLKGVQDRTWMSIHNVDGGTFKIEKLLLFKRTLLVLDGIDKYEQLDALIGTKGLHPGSKIIITSKKGLLTEKCRLFGTEVPPKHTTHLLHSLNDKESLQLLSWHAFGITEAKEHDKEESIKVVKYCKGHPLALKVLGSSIGSEDATLEDILESLGKEINPDILKVLKISFDSLPNENHKELFKHIACFFVGEDRKFTEEILKACGVCKFSGIKNLISRCLLTVGSSNKLMMHQLLQDMGRDIVRQESPKKPWKRSLIWHHVEYLDVLLNRKGTSKVQGVALDMKTIEQEAPESYTANKRFVLKSFPLLDWVHILLLVIFRLFDWIFGIRKGGFETHPFNVRLLQLNYVKLDGSYKKFPKGLRWLCMHGFPLAYIPLELHMENMVALDMSNSKLKHLWKKPKMLGSLKFLNLSNCHELVSIGHFSCIPLLERLMLAGCASLIEICESIGNRCDELEVLDMSECTKLKRLPRSIGKLKKLRKLSIEGCSNLGEFPHGIKDMESLQVLEANNINISAVLKGIPGSPKSFVISFPYSLVHLSLKNNNLSNESFPDDFSSLSMLQALFLDENPIDSLPNFVKSLTRLQFLSLEYCHRLKTILCAPDISISTHNCCSLEKITFSPEKSDVPNVTYANHYSLTEIQGKFKLQAIAEIDDDILHSLGWIDIEYVKYQKLSMAGFGGYYRYTGRKLPAQMLYEHGIFSAYLKGQEVPKWFTHRSNRPSFTLQSSIKNHRILGLNLCIVNKILSSRGVGTSRISIINKTKNCSYVYQPLMYVIPEANEKITVWLSHWMFRNNEFEDGDEVSVHVSVKFYYVDNTDYICYGGEGPDYAHVKEYGISLVYSNDDDDDDDDDDGNQKEDPLAYYISWKNIIAEDLFAARFCSGDRVLLPDWPYMGIPYQDSDSSESD